MREFGLQLLGGVYQSKMVARGGLEPPTQGFSVRVTVTPQKLYAYED